MVLSPAEQPAAWYRGGAFPRRDCLQSATRDPGPGAALAAAAPLHERRGSHVGGV